MTTHKTNGEPAPNSEDQQKGDKSEDGTTAEKSRFENIQTALGLIYEHFPKAFFKEGDPKPLKLGIFDDLKARIEGIEGLSITKVRAAVRIYTSRLKYLHSIKEGARRIDLDGNEADEVTKEHAEYAKQKIEEALARKKESQKNKPPKDKGSYKKKRFNPKDKDRDRRKPHGKMKVKDLTPEDLVSGKEVLVYSNNSYVKGVISKIEQKGSVLVTLRSGMTVNMPPERLKLEAKEEK